MFYKTPSTSNEFYCFLSNNTTVHNNTEIIVTKSSNLHNSFEEKRTASIPVRLEKKVQETFALRGEARAVQEKMFIIFYASLAKTGWIRAVEIVIQPMTA